MTYDQILRSLEDRNLSVVGKNTGISKATFTRMKRGGAYLPRRSTLELLSRYIDGTAYEPQE